MKYVFGLLMMMLAGLASATTTPPDYTALTGGIDFSTAAAAVLAGYLLLANFGLVVKGGRVILRAIGLKV